METRDVTRAEIDKARRRFYASGRRVKSLSPEEVKGKASARNKARALGQIG